MAKTLQERLEERLDEKSRNSKKNAAAFRQREVVDRRSESGLITKKFHFSNETIDAIQKIGTEMGFTKSELRKNENLSAIIENCIDAFSDMSIKGKPKTKDALYLKQICKIIHFKSKEKEKGKLKYNNEAIADFLTVWGYKTPVLITKNNKGLLVNWIQDAYWTPTIVKKLKDYDYIQHQIVLLNKKSKPEKIKIRISGNIEEVCSTYSDEIFRLKQILG